MLHVHVTTIQTLYTMTVLVRLMMSVVFVVDQELLKVIVIVTEIS